MYLGLVDEAGLSARGPARLPRQPGRSAQRHDPRARGVRQQRRALHARPVRAHQARRGDSYDAILIDDRAIGTDLGKKFVLVLKPDNSLEYRLVDLGHDVDGLRVVEQGLAADDVIVVNGLQHVMPGIKVQHTHVRDGRPVGARRWTQVGRRRQLTTRQCRALPAKARTHGALRRHP